MQAIETEIDETLRRLSPEYKLQEKGYRLPVPRIRKTPQAGDPVESQQEAIDVREVLKSRERTLISASEPARLSRALIAKPALSAHGCGMR